MNSFIKKSFAISVIILIQLLIIAYVKFLFGSYSRSLGYTFNEFLRINGGYQFFLAAYVQKIILFLLPFYLLVTFVLVGKKLRIDNSYILSTKFTIDRFTIFINIFSFFSIIILLITITNPFDMVLNSYSYKSILYSLSPMIWIIYLYSICNLLFPIKELLLLIVKNRVLFLTIAIIVFIMTYPEIMEIFFNFWSELLLTPTIEVASSISQFFSLNYHVMPNLINGVPDFGTTQFSVAIYPACSGYEGMSLIVLLLGVYCYIQKEQLIIPRSLLIFPFAVFIMFLLNGFRIFALIAIGHYWSPQLALNGFHIVGGWLNLLIVFITSLLMLNYIPFFQKRGHIGTSFYFRDSVLFSPLMVLIASSLLTKVICPDFPWLYPFNIFAATLVLYYFRNTFLPYITRPSVNSIVIGVVVFLIWIYLIPDDAAVSAKFMVDLDSAPMLQSFFWLILRVIGASIIIPIAEELAFRGYIQPNLNSWLDRYSSKSMSIALSLGATSFLFGFLHSDIFAGSIAGLLYGLVYLQRRQLMDAVVSHAVTNALLAIYVLIFGYWSYW